MQVVKKCLDLGADGYLVKPIQAKTIQLAWQYCYRCTPHMLSAFAVDDTSLGCC
jgi:response regulator of citrate/malate metabolism